MKRKIFTTTTLVCGFLICLAAVVADLSGKWTGTLKTPDGNEFPLSYTLKLDGGKLTGMASSPQGDVAIGDGKVDGDTFTFTVPVNGADIKHTGKYYAAADSVGMDIDFNGQKFHTTLKRFIEK